MKRIKVSQARDMLVVEQQWCRKWIEMQCPSLPPIPQDMIEKNRGVHSHITVKAYMNGLGLGIAILTDLLTNDTARKAKKALDLRKEIQLVFDDILSGAKDEN